MTIRTYGLASSVACCVAATAHAQAGLSHVFDAPEGANLVGVTPAADGSVYARLSRGGSNDAGTVVRRMPDGQVYTLHAFEGTPPPASDYVWYAPLRFSHEGVLYGTSSREGQHGYGSVFRFDDCNGFEIVHDFTLEDGGSPRGPLVPAADGGFYVVTSSENGKILYVARDGATRPIYEGLYKPEGGVTLASDGYLYGTLPWLGTGREAPERRGELYRVREDGTDFSSRLRLYPSYFNPRGELIEGPDGYLYGTSANVVYSPGPHVFRLPLGAAPFDYSEIAQDGGPLAGLAFGDDGNVYGAGRAFFRLTTAGLLTYIRNFDGDAPQPTAALQPHPDGGFYVPAADDLLHLSQAGGISQLHRFGYQQGRTLSKLWQGRDGRVYGTTSEGGAHDSGTLFRFESDSQLHALVSWPAPLPSSAYQPSLLAELTEAEDGTLYGIRGRIPSALFSVSTNGELTLLHTIDPAELTQQRRFGVEPIPLVSGQDGALYGISASSDGNLRETQVFRYDLGSDALSVVARLAQRTVSTLVGGPDGALYVLSTPTDATEQTRLTRVAADGEVTDVHAFRTDSEGHLPSGRLVVAADGGIYGFARPRAPDRPKIIYRWDSVEGMSIAVSLPAAVAISSPQLSIAPDGTFVLTGFSDGGYSAHVIEPAGRVIEVPGPIMGTFIAQDSQIYSANPVQRGPFSGFLIEQIAR